MLTKQHEIFVQSNLDLQNELTKRNLLSLLQIEMSKKNQKTTFLKSLYGIFGIVSDLCYTLQLHMILSIMIKQLQKVIAQTFCNLRKLHIQ